MLRPALRASLGLALLALAALEVRSLQATLAVLGERRTAVAETVRVALLSARPRASALSSGAGLDAALEEVARWLPTVERHEIDLLSGNGQVLRARPPGPRPEHVLDGGQRAALSRGAVVTVGPLAGPHGPRLMSYAAIDSPGGVIVRVSSPLPGLTEWAGSSSTELARHVATLAVLFVGTLLTLLPGRTAAGSGPRSDPYAEAMLRLGRQGEERGRELERLRGLVADREAMSRAGELSAGMAHELRNGLGTIVAYARLAEQDPAAARGAAERIREECADLDRVIKRFSEFVRDERLQRTFFDVRRLAERVAAREAQARAGAAVEVGPGPELFAWGDEDLLERALENLVRNAREAAGPDGRVAVRWTREGAQTLLSVADDGPGLQKETRAQLRPFFTTKPGGLGLGLPLVAKIAALHGGGLELLDREPKGTVAVLRFPDSSATEGSDGNPGPASPPRPA